MFWNWGNTKPLSVEISLYPLKGCGNVAVDFQDCPLLKEAFPFTCESRQPPGGCRVPWGPSVGLPLPHSSFLMLLVFTSYFHFIHPCCCSWADHIFEISLLRFLLELKDFSRLWQPKCIPPPPPNNLSHPAGLSVQCILTWYTTVSSGAYFQAGMHRILTSMAQLLLLLSPASLCRILINCGNKHLLKAMTPLFSGKRETVPIHPSTSSLPSGSLLVFSLVFLFRL